MLDAGYQLFALNGFDATTMDDIALKSGVSRRTLFRNFGTKEQIALAYQDTILDDLVARAAARPRNEDALVALIETISGFVRELRHEEALELSDLLVQNPSLRAYNLQKYEAIELALTETIKSRIDSPDQALKARIAASSVIAAWRVANEEWAKGDRTEHPVCGTTKAFNLLRATLIIPPRARSD